MVKKAEIRARLKGDNKMMSKKRLQFNISCMLLILAGVVHGTENLSEQMRSALDRIDIKNDIFAVLGMPDAQLRPLLAEFIIERDLIIFFQSPNPDDIATMRRVAQERGFLGTRIFVEEGDFKSIHLAGNLAGLVLVSASAQSSVSEEELLRVAYPGGLSSLAKNSSPNHPLPIPIAGAIHITVLTIIHSPRISERVHLI